MYNMDHSIKMTSLSQLDYSASGVLSIYLHSPLGVVTGCTYSSVGDLSTNGEIICSQHGTLTPGKTDPVTGG